jgi:hypothetical protein
MRLLLFLGALCFFTRPVRAYDNGENEAEAGVTIVEEGSTAAKTPVAEENPTAEENPAAEESSTAGSDVAEPTVERESANKEEPGVPAVEKTADEKKRAQNDKAQSEKGSEGQERKKLHWRKDPATLRHPGSYIGFGGGYTQSRAWFVPQEEEFNDELRLGPFHSWQSIFRVGDAFFEWLAVGFQINLTYGRHGDSQIMGAFGLLLDVTFYPWRGFGIRPSVGLGFSYASGEKDFEFGYGGPGDFSLAITYEFRLTRLFAVAPVAQVYWITGDDYDAFSFCFGIEFIKWFDTPTG